MYKRLIRPLLFLKDPEEVHHLVFEQLKKVLSNKMARKLAERQYLVKDEMLEQELFGIRFPNPVGLAAGFDKDALAIDELSSLGFGFIEIGTVTPKPQPGNEKPRLFRLPKDRALINRMGFNNGGAAVVAERLQKRKSKTIIGGNIGKNKDTAYSMAVEDYLSAYLTLRDHVDYFTVNVSSPNTPGLRGLQERGPLTELLVAIKAIDEQQEKPRPILLKIAPDLTNDQLDDIIAIVQEVGIAGVIATNTTISREGLTTSADEVEKLGAGGLSGAPLADRSTQVIRYLHRKSGGAFPIIGVGGILSPADALEKLAAGASLIQLYTGFIYEGPDLVRNINKAILSVKQDLLHEKK